MNKEVVIDMEEVERYLSTMEKNSENSSALDEPFFAGVKDTIAKIAEGRFTTAKLKDVKANIPCPICACGFVEFKQSSPRIGIVDGRYEVMEGDGHHIPQRVLVGECDKCEVSITMNGVYRVNPDGEHEPTVAAIIIQDIQKAMTKDYAKKHYDTMMELIPSLKEQAGIKEDE